MSQKPKNRFSKRMWAIAALALPMLAAVFYVGTRFDFARPRSAPRQETPLHHRDGLTLQPYRKGGDRTLPVPPAIAALSPEERKKKRDEHVAAAKEKAAQEDYSAAIRELWKAKSYGDDPELQGLVDQYWKKHGESLKQDTRNHL